MRATKKVTLAAAMVVALFVGLATPASAAVYPLEVTGGTLDTVLGSFDLTPGSQGTPPCPEEDPNKPEDLTLRTDADSLGGNPGDWSLDGSFWGQFQLPAGSGTWWQADFEVLQGSGGTYGAPSAGEHPASGVIAIQVTISYIGEDPGPYDCSKEEVACVITGVFAVEGHIDGTPDPHANHLAQMSGATIEPLVAAPCSGPFVAVNDTNASLTDLEVQG